MVSATYCYQNELIPCKTGVRKSKPSPPRIPPAPEFFVYLRDVLPSFADDLKVMLRKTGDRDLAAKIDDLRIYGRCCDRRLCGRFYCLPREEREELYRRKQTHMRGDFILAGGEILEVETYS